MDGEGGKDIILTQKRPVALLERQEAPKIHVLKDPEQALVDLYMGEGRFMASRGENFRDASFGRDTVRLSLDLLLIKPQIAKEVILARAPLQGLDFVRTDYAATDKIAQQNYIERDERYGQGYHEVRELFINGRRINPKSERILRELGEKFGGTSQRALTYKSHDVTPLDALLIGRYYEEVDGGKKILDEPYVRKDGEPSTIRKSHLAQQSWIETNIAESGIGLLAFRANPPNDYWSKGWMDSETALMHDINGKGEHVNYGGPIALLEVNCYAYDALIRAARIYEKDRPEDAKRWRELAANLAEKTVAEFWMEDEKYFAMGVDIDPKTGKTRKIETLSANGALILDSDILDTLPMEKKQEYITGIVNKIFSEEFITDVGVRCRAKRHAGLIGYADYHGTYASWSKETYDIAKGLRKQGLHALARQFEQRIVNAVEKASEYYEFSYVDLDGSVNYRPKETGLPFANGRKVLFGTNLPDEDQAWTISAYIASKYNLDHMPIRAEEGTWQYRLEESLLPTIPPIPESSIDQSETVPFIVETNWQPSKKLAA